MFLRKLRFPGTDMLKESGFPAHIGIFECENAPPPMVQYFVVFIGRGVKIGRQGECQKEGCNVDFPRHWNES